MPSEESNLQYLIAHSQRLKMFLEVEIGSKRQVVELTGAKTRVCTLTRADLSRVSSGKRHSTDVLKRQSACYYYSRGSYYDHGDKASRLLAQLEINANFK